MRAVLADGLHEVFLLGVLIAALALVTSLLLPERQLQGGTVPVEAGTAPDDDGLLALEGRALFDVLLLGEPWHDGKRAEATTELISAAPW
jgi:hypothetical protein